MSLSVCVCICLCHFNTNYLIVNFTNSKTHWGTCSFIYNKPIHTKISQFSTQKCTMNSIELIFINLHLHLLYMSQSVCVHMLVSFSYKLSYCGFQCIIKNIETHVFFFISINTTHKIFIFQYTETQNELHRGELVLAMFSEHEVRK